MHLSSVSRSVLGIVMVLCAATPSEAQSPEPIHWWDFEINADDRIGDRTGTLVNAVPATGVWGGTGYYFDGSSHIATDYVPSIPDGSSFTVMVWAKLPQGTVSSGGAFVWLERTESQQISISYGYPCDHTDAGAAFRDDGNNKQNVADQDTCGTFESDGGWYHYTAVFDGSEDTMAYYVGRGMTTELVGTASVSALGAVNVTDPLPIYFGARIRNDEVLIPMTGWLDEIKFFDQALTESEIRAHIAPPGIPTVSEWGVVTMMLVLLVAATLVHLGRRVPCPQA